MDLLKEVEATKRKCKELQQTLITMQYLLKRSTTRNNTKIVNKLSLKISHLTEIENLLNSVETENGDGS